MVTKTREHKHYFTHAIFEPGIDLAKCYPPCNYEHYSSKDLLDPKLNARARELNLARGKTGSIEAVTETPAAATTTLASATAQIATPSNPSPPPPLDNHPYENEKWWSLTSTERLEMANEAFALGKGGSCTVAKKHGVPMTKLRSVVIKLSREKNKIVSGEKPERNNWAPGVSSPEFRIGGIIPIKDETLLLKKVFITEDKTEEKMTLKTVLTLEEKIRIVNEAIAAGDYPATAAKYGIDYRVLAAWKNNHFPHTAHKEAMPKVPALPDFDTDWSEEIKLAWFKLFDKLLKIGG